MKDSNRVLLALVVALVLGIVIGRSGSAALLGFANGWAPVGTLWVNAIRMTVIPLVVSLLITGVASASDLRVVGRLGTRTLGVFLGLLLFVAAIILPVAPLIYSLLPTDPSGRPSLPEGAAQAAGELAANQPPTFSAWLVSLIPTNPIAAASSGAMVPLIIFAMLLALAIARSPGPARATLVGFFQALSEAMLVLVGWVVALAPLGVFALILPLAAKGGVGLAGAVGFYIVAYALTNLGASLALYPLVAWLGRIPLSTFAKSALPAQLIGFSSSSSIATLPAMVEAAEKGMGVPNRVTGFVLPLAVSTFKPAAPVAWTMGALFVGWFYGVHLGAVQLATITAAAVFLAFAAPGVPRGAFLMLTPLFLAVGLPAEGIGLLIAVDVLPDMFATVLNITGDLAAVVLVNRTERKEAQS